MYVSLFLPDFSSLRKARNSGEDFPSEVGAKLVSCFLVSKVVVSYLVGSYEVVSYLVGSYEVVSYFLKSKVDSFLVS